MASEPQIPGKRRSERVLITIPVQVSHYARDGSPIKESGETLVVTEQGALLRLPSRLVLNAQLEVMNYYSQQVERFRVAHVDGEPKDGQFHVIVEMLRPRDGFWEIRFPSRESKRYPPTTRACPAP